MSKKGRILVAMSGGIDSSLAAVLLHEEGYEVVGMTMKTWDYASSGSSGKKETGCCSLDSINDARAVAVDLGFPHYILDIRNEFGDAVIDYFTDEYISGRTPNPCIMCNTHIKWEALLKRADKLDCEFIATGHYAKIREENSRFVISKGIDESKDQSYVLWGVSQESLSRTVLPLGGLTKAEIRKMAQERGFFDLVNKPESYEICFIPDNDYRSFLKKRRPEIKEQLEGGEFVSPEGKVIGKHDGYPFYTIGQRKGLGVAFGEPVYVVDILKERNQVVLGSQKDLMHRGMKVRNLNLQKYASLEGKEWETVTKIRSNDKGAPAIVKQNGEEVDVVFHEPVSAIARGQAAVFYEGDDVIGGGWIDAAYDC
jgi:tRNA-specific 2-thiouridylase